MNLEKLLKLENKNLYVNKETAMEIFNPSIMTSNTIETPDVYPIGQIGSNTVFVNANIKDNNVYDENDNVIKL